MAEKLWLRAFMAQRLIIQDEGGSRATLLALLPSPASLLQEVSGAAREPIPLSELIVATECGGSDAWSGVTANPAVGIASDLMVSGRRHGDSVRDLRVHWRGALVGCSRR